MRVFKVPGLTLLVADDEAIVRNFVKAVIKEEGLPVSKILEAGSGPEAVREALDKAPQAALIDVRMPGFDGLKTCELIKKERPETHIVFLSAHDDFELVRGAFTLGASDYILKPLHHGKLVEIISGIADKLALTTAPGAAADNDPLVQAVEKYIEENMETNLNLADIARAVFSSPFHLSRKFRKISGLALKDYISERRLEAAKKLLGDPGLSITEVAERTGFNSSSYFATCFKAGTGQSPSQFRQKLIKR